MTNEAWANLAFFLLFFVIAYLLFIRPARKRAQQAAALQSSLSAGDEIMLTSGIFGWIVSVDGETVSVEIANGVVVRAHRGAIGKQVSDLPTSASYSPSDGSAAAGASAVAAPTSPGAQTHVPGATSSARPDEDRSSLDSGDDPKEVR